ncbi:exodeoxyribonuclease V subunit alpha [Neisseria gonorrhoeae]|uniref:exodeoxyribonuclease V subunit alpha n=1 Tax=Neisseria gonorrhoeae TaxID=485 RepID=UPI00064CD27E|nr:exodeoxyribonuclease V subunit alpha [Neisseria gonorrhoeae]KLT02921.1 exodeoxyribonuclease V subunit alpha [Neisseria gonorrhoeae MU_NG17]
MELQTDEFAQAAARAAIRFLERYAGSGNEVLANCTERLFQALQNGHSFIRLSGDEADALSALAPVVGTSAAPLILEGRRLFLGRMWQLEYDLAAEIKRLAAVGTSAPDAAGARQNLAKWFQGAGSEGQRDAAALALLQFFMVITGGPGTGKTTTVAKLLALICGENENLPHIALAAPTGKAAAHMARALHRAINGFDAPEAVRRHLLKLEGQTVHRLLKLSPPKMQAAFDHIRPLPFDVLIVDEASMLDTALMLQLLKAVKTGARVILLGDENQLPSVGIGAVLSVLSQKTVLDGETHQRLAGFLPEHGFSVSANPPVLAQNTAHLSFSHRFGDNSGIGCLARAVVSGDEGAWALFDRFPDELEHSECSPNARVERLYRAHKAYWQAVKDGNIEAAYAGISDIVVLAAWRQDAEDFNEAYCSYVRRKMNIPEHLAYFAGEPIMIRQNDYALELFNGDIGLIMEDVGRQGSLAAYFADADGFKKVAVSCLPEFEPAFAMTVHKSQGSEYREVWLLPPSDAPSDEGDDALSGLSKELLYTAITRAREKFVFFGGKKTFCQAVNTVKVRQTALDSMLERVFSQE